jgi:curved DNA-binding protein CbpA
MKHRAAIQPTVADPYATLGLAPTADLDEIKRAYFAQVRLHPPEHDPETFKRIRAAYEQLRDPKQRQQTDVLRWQIWPEPELADLFHTRSDITLELDVADVIRAARSISDLSRTDFREDYREVRL